MNGIVRKRVAFGLAALTLVAGITASAPAQAGWRGHGWRHGYGYPRYGWRGGYRGWGWGGAAAAGALSGFALGALAGSAYAYGPGYYGYGGCLWQNQPTYDAFNNFLGYQPVWTCY